MSVGENLKRGSIYMLCDAILWPSSWKWPSTSPGDEKAVEYVP
jgi:hypothetical protein